MPCNILWLYQYNITIQNIAIFHCINPTDDETRGRHRAVLSARTLCASLTFHSYKNSNVCSSEDAEKDLLVEKAASLRNHQSVTQRTMELMRGLNPQLLICFVLCRNLKMEH